VRRNGALKYQKLGSLHVVPLNEVFKNKTEELNETITANLVPTAKVRFTNQRKINKNRKDC
jgi:hypothetical protein